MDPVILILIEVLIIIVVLIVIKHGEGDRTHFFQTNERHPSMDKYTHAGLQKPLHTSLRTFLLLSRVKHRGHRKKPAAFYFNFNF